MRVLGVDRDRGGGLGLRGTRVVPPTAAGRASIRHPPGTGDRSPPRGPMPPAVVTPGSGEGGNGGRDSPTWLDPRAVGVAAGAGSNPGLAGSVATVPAPG